MRTKHDYFARVVADPAVCALSGALKCGETAAVTGGAGSSTVLVAGAIARNTGRPILLVLAHLDEADEALEELSACGVKAIRFPALEYVPGETNLSLELVAERLGAMRLLAEMSSTERASVILCPIQALMQPVPSAEAAERCGFDLRPGACIPGGVQGLAGWLADRGYKRVDSVSEAGEFAIRGGIIDIFPLGAALQGNDASRADVTGAVRLDFFGDDIESVHEIDIDTMGSDRKLSRVLIVGESTGAEQSAATGVHLISALVSMNVRPMVMLAETMEIVEQARGYFERVTDGSLVFGPPEVLRVLRELASGFAEINQFSVAAASTDARFQLPVRPLPEFSRDGGEAIAELGELSQSHEVHVCCQNEGETQRLTELLAEHAPESPSPTIHTRYLHRGFVWEHEDSGTSTVVVPYHELLHRFQTRRRIRRIKAAKATEAFYDISAGDYVVHADHGIGKFLGLRTMSRKKPRQTAEARAEALLRGESVDESDLREEFLTLEFAGGAKLHVPATQIDKVQKYIGGFHGKPKLSTLGGRRWSAQKEQVKDAVRDLAAELLRVQAAREHMPGVKFPSDTTWQREFEAEFPYEETEDQLAALVEIKKDMCADRPMDRLLCGDVGYGKTELAIRAAFKAAEFGKQIAVLVPTTLLAEQHERTFRGRFADYPFRVESLSRFKTTKEVNDVLAALRKGHVDIVIGTHRLLSKDVRFADLGLVIVDEEQRFGVEHKQALLSLRLTADVLTLSATPIPRTLHMAMLGLRDISSLTTPPLDRRAVVTEVLPYNAKRVASAIARELNREGQVYFIHNRVHNIQSVADEVQKLAPTARIVIGHGQMPDGELEGVMRKFVNREADILVATTIVESGIDIPTANTMFINDADRFGLADLHQLRGRVGRYKHRAYCYLLLPPDRTVSETAVKRLRAIEEFSMLGAGFKIAMRDLEIRGAGNLLGAEQSGHIATVGYEMYCRLLEESARELRNEPRIEPTATTIEIGLSGSIPGAYIAHEGRRLEAYRRVAGARSLSELEKAHRDVTEAYGSLPRATNILFDLAELRIVTSEMGAKSISVHESDVIIRCEDAAPFVDRLGRAQGTVRAISGATDDGLFEVYFRPKGKLVEEPESLINVLRHHLVRHALQSARSSTSA